MTITKIEIAKIHLNSGTQMREALDQNTVDEYAAGMIAGDQFPPVRVFNYGEVYWLTDGFHRLAAAKQIGYLMIEADVQLGGLRDAIIDSTTVNATHGLRRSREATRNAIKTLLKDEEWGLKPDSQIAKKVGCDHKTVGARRAELEASGEIPKMETRMVERNGTTYEMKTATKPESTTTNQGVTVEVGDVVSFLPDLNNWNNKIGRITAIEGERITIELAISRRHSKDEQPATYTITSRARKVSDTEYAHWHNYALHDPSAITLYAWKDHFISLDAPYKAPFPQKSKARFDGYNWKPTENWDTGLAWRFDASYLDKWTEEGIPFVILVEADLPERMKMILGKAGRARGGEVNKPLEPEAIVDPELSDKGPGLDQPNESVIKIGNIYRHTDPMHRGTWFYVYDQASPTLANCYEVDAIGRQANNASFTFMASDLVLDRSHPLALLGTRLYHFKRLVEYGGYNGGRTVIVWTLDQEGNRLRSYGADPEYLTQHPPSDAHTDPVESLPVAPPKAAPIADSILNDEQLDTLQASVERMFTFLEMRLIPDNSDLLNDLENVYQAMHKARAEYRKLLDPATGQVKV